MDHKLKTILQEVTSIQSALLRFRNDEGQQNLRVRIASNTGNTLHFTTTGEIPAGMKPGNKLIHLIQKYQGDYFFISGHILGELRDTPRIQSLTINKACWYVRKTKGSVTWLREKYIYENNLEEMCAAS